MRGLTGYLQDELNLKEVRIVTSSDYASVLRSLEKGTIDFAWLGPAAFILGNRASSRLIPLAQAKRRTGTSYHGLFITRKDSGIAGIDDVKGKTIGFVDPDSTSGYRYPVYFLQRLNIDPHRQCKVVFLKKHDAVLTAVLGRKVDVGVCLQDTLETIADRRVHDQLLVLGQTDPVPSDIVACRADYPAKGRDRFKAALLKTTSLKQTINPATGLPPIMEFVPVDLKAIEGVRAVMKAVAAASGR